MNELDQMMQNALEESTARICGLIDERDALLKHVSKLEEERTAMTQEMSNMRQWEIGVQMALKHSFRWPIIESGEEVIQLAKATPIPMGAGLIANERARQIKEEGYTREHDIQHTEQQLLRAAIAHALFALKDNSDVQRLIAELWPWNAYDIVKLVGDPVGTLAKAGALIAAEIDRISKL